MIPIAAEHFSEIMNCSIYSRNKKNELNNSHRNSLFSCFLSLKYRTRSLLDWGKGEPRRCLLVSSALSMVKIFSVLRHYFESFSHVKEYERLNALGAVIPVELVIKCRSLLVNPASPRRFNNLLSLSTYGRDIRSFISNLVHRQHFPLLNDVLQIVGIKKAPCPFDGKSVKGFQGGHGAKLCLPQFTAHLSIGSTFVAIKFWCKFCSNLAFNMLSIAPIYFRSQGFCGK